MTAGRDEQAVAFVLDLLAGKCRAQAVSTAAALGIPDLIADEPKLPDTLASDIDCDASFLERLLIVLVGLGLCEQRPDGFVLTECGTMLRSESLGPLATFVGAPEQWDPWSRLRDVIQEGRPNAFQRTHGKDLYRYLAADPRAAERYDDAIETFTRLEAAALCRVYDFVDAHTVVDLGGGRGALLVEVLSRWPRLRACYVDLPHVAERARPRLDAALGERVEVVAGDFFETMPEGADVYVLKRILHNWDDRRARDLLARCASAMSPIGKVLAIEAILSPDCRMDSARLLDIEMLVLTGGRERRKPELRRLFHGAGLKLVRVERLQSGSWLLVGSRLG